MATYLEFEKPIADLKDQLEKTVKIEEENNIDTSKAAAELEKKIKQVSKEIYKHLTPWQKVQVSRHPDRPYTLAYIKAITGGEFMELHGDRNFKDDKAIVGGIGVVDDKPLMLIGHQKGINTKMRQFRNFGMPNPEGYRKALRLMKLAEKFQMPIITFIDTPGAYPGLEAEERGQAEAIAKNIMEMCTLKVPVICIVIGEGASGGALGIGVGDRVLMLENTWYSVISPESCSTILWRSRDFKEKAADSLKLTADDMSSNKLVDGIIKEPIGGAHANPHLMFLTVKKEILKQLDKLQKLDGNTLVKNRIRKYTGMGVFKG